MQTFLPDPDFDYCARVLDRMRLGSQRRECVQLLYTNEPEIRIGTPELIERKNAAALRGELPKRGWSHHAAAVMWRGRTPALVHYLAAMDREWIRRGYMSNLVFPVIDEALIMPSWLGDVRVHSSHRSSLLFKKPEHYGQFGWIESPAMDYYWPGACSRVTSATV